MSDKAWKRQEREVAAIAKRAERLDAALDSLEQTDVPTEYVDAWAEDCFPKIKDRLPEAELD